MRKFAIVTLDWNDELVDRFNLDLVSDISGIGFELSLSKVETDVEDFITKIVQKKNSFSMKVWLGGYATYNAMKLFIAKHINDYMALEYYDNIYLMYSMGKPSKLSLSGGEKDIYGHIEADLTFEPTTPFFKIVQNNILIQYSASGKTYPYTYPYTYGATEILNNEIINDYIKDIPLIITLTGSMASPKIELKDKDGIVYSTVELPALSLAEGQKLIINGATRKVLFTADDGATYQDYFSYLNPVYDSFLRAKALETSKIDINLSASDTGSLTGSRRQYLL